MLASGGITDPAGNALAEFRASYTYSPGPAGGLNTVLAMRPLSGATGVPSNTNVTWFFAQPVTSSGRQSSLIVVANGNAVPGSFAVTPDGLAATFQPNTPFAAGARVEVDQAGALYPTFYPYSFTVMPGPPTPLTLLSYTPNGFNAPANAVMEFEFSSDISTGQGLVTLHRNTGAGPVIFATESIPRPHVLRLTPAAQFSPGNIFAVLGPNVFSGLNANDSGGSLAFTIVAPTASPAGTLVFGPPPNATNVPLNASVRMLFPAPLDPLSVTASAITIQSGGAALPVMIYFSNYANNTGVVATPLAPLPADSQITVSTTGIVDYYGFPVADQNWSFTAGVMNDFIPVTVVDQNVPVPGAGGTFPAIPPNTPLVFVFNKPIDPTSLTRLQVQSGALVTPLQPQFSPDMTTVSLYPNPAFPRGQEYQFILDNVSDLSGNSAGGGQMNFSIAFDPDTTPPQMLQATPGDGQTGLPLNAQIMLDFDKPLLGTSFGGVTLTQAGNPVALVQEPDDLRRIRMAPAIPLQSNTTYTLTVQGVSDLSGNVMTAPVTQTFTTGSLMDLTAPGSPTLLAPGAPNAAIEISFKKPVSPATVDSQSITLSSISTFYIPVPATVALSADGRLATLTPVSPLQPAAQYSVSLIDVRDLTGNAFPQISFENFTTTATPLTVPPVVIFTPPDGSTSVPVSTRLEATVSSQIQPQPGVTLLQLSSNGQPLSGTVNALGNNQFSFAPSLPLSPSTTYRLDFASVVDSRAR